MTLLEILGDPPTVTVPSSDTAGVPPTVHPRAWILMEPRVRGSDLGYGY